MNPFDSFRTRIDKAGEFIPEEDPKHLQLLKHPQRIFQFALPVVMESGELRIFPGYRVQHSDIRGPTKGGIRFHPQVDHSDRNGNHWSEEYVDDRLQRWMKAAFDNVWRLKVTHNVDMRTAAGILAVRRIVSAYKMRGVRP